MISSSMISSCVSGKQLLQDAGDMCVHITETTHVVRKAQCKEDTSSSHMTP
jgi:hypothetical protein